MAHNVHEIADEIRSVNDAYSSIIDDFACFKAYMDAHPTTITEEGIFVNDNMPKFADLCAHLHNHAALYSRQMVGRFDNMLTEFIASIAQLGETNPAIAKMSKVELSATAIAMKALSKSFDGIKSQLVTAINMNGVKQADFLKGIEVMKAVIDDRVIARPKPAESSTEAAGAKGTGTDDAPKGFIYDDQIGGEENGGLFKQLYTLFKDVDGEERARIKVKLLDLLAIFARICATKRCPISVGRSVITMTKYLSELPVGPLLDYVSIPRGSIVIVQM